MANRIDLRWIKREQIVRPIFRDDKLVGFSFRRSGSSYYAQKWFMEDAWDYLLIKVHNTRRKANESRGNIR